MNKQFGFRITSKKTLFICILMLALCLMFVSIGAALDVDISKNGNAYTTASSGRIDAIAGTNAVHLNGGTLYYEFNVSEWAPWLSSFYIGVDHCKADKNEASKGGVWVKVEIKGNDQVYYPFVDLTNESSTRSVQWTSFATDGPSKLEASGSGYKITFKIFAKDGITDHAEADVYVVWLRLNLNYDQFNTLQVDGSPKVVNFGDNVDLGGTIPDQNVTIKNIGSGSAIKNWSISSPNWINSKSGSVTAGGTGTITLQINSANISSANINELNGKLVPIANSGLDPNAAGLKGDFYHVPNADLSNLNDALANTNKKLVFSGIFPTIEFHKAGGLPTESLSEDDVFKSGTLSATVRRDFVAIFTGFIKINTAGNHTFLVTHDDGVILKVDGTSVISNQGWKATADTGTKNLNPGIYPIEIDFFQGGGSKSLTLEWTPPGGTTAVVPNNVLYNGLNILAKAGLKKPTVTSTTTLGSNSKVNVAVNQSSKFTVTSTIGSTNVPVTGYLWQWVSGSAAAGTGFDSTTAAEKNYSFSEPGNYTVYCKAVDQKGVESALISIPVCAWNLPTVKDTPPSAAITAKTVSWYTNKYAGVAGQAINLMADGAPGSNNPASTPAESLQRFIWDFNNDWSNIELTQEPATSPKPYTWSAATPSATIRCRAVNNFGIQSADKLFTVTVYSPVTANIGGPYNGRPTMAVNLAGSINQSNYPGAMFLYQWQVNINNVFTDITTGSDGKASYTWTTEGDYQVKFNATVTTSEGLALTGSATANVTVSAGMPTAMPGGPYRGGINGGNFSPIQVEGNPPDFIEADDIGRVVDWTWIFDHGMEILGENVDDMVSALTENTSTAEKITSNVNSGTMALAIRCISPTGTTNQRVRTTMPGWSFNIVQNPQAPNEFRYITFAWRKDGGTGIMLQFNGSPGGWAHRYHAGANAANWTPSIQVATAIPAQWTVVTRDLFTDFGAFTIKGIAFTPMDGTAGYFDDMYLHKSPTPPRVVRGSSIATHAYSTAGTHTVSLKVKSQYGKWGLVSMTNVQVIDGKITGYVRAADLRTPVKDAQLTLTSSHVDKNVLAAIAAANPTALHVTNDGSGIYTLTDSKGYYAFEHIPLGSYRVAASKVDANNTIHEFETGVKATELTMDAPNQLAIDFVDLSVFPISGKIVYSIKKNNMDVMVEDVTIEAQSVGSTNSIKSLPSNKAGDATGSNYSLPLFSGKYLFLATLQEHNISLKSGTPNYDATTGLITIDRARTDIDFIDYTAYTLNVFVKDSGGYSMSGRSVSVSGDNGQATGTSDQEGKLVATLPPGKYTVTVPGAQPETSEVDLTGGDQVVNMTIPVKIVVSFSPKPKLFDVPDDFLASFGLTPSQNPEGYMYYYPPEPRAHTYVITATANGKPVVDFELFITDEVSMLTEDLPEEQEIQVQGEEERYTVTAGLPRQDRSTSPPKAAPKRIIFRAEKEGYLASDSVADNVIVIGDVAVGSAQKIVSVPVVNYTVLHDPPGDGSYSYLDDSIKLKGIVSGMTLTIGEAKIPVYPSPWRDERKVADFSFEKEPSSSTTFKDLEGKGLMGSDRTVTPAIGAFMLTGLAEAGVAAANFLTGPFAFITQVALIPILGVSLEAGTAIPGVTGVVQYEVSPSRHLETPSGDSLPDLMGPGKGDIYVGEGWTLGLQTKYRMGVKLVNNQWQLQTNQIETYDILKRTNQYMYTVRDIENLIQNLDTTIAQAAEGSAEKTKLTNARKTWQGLLDKNLAYVWERDYVSQGRSFEEFKSEQGLPDESENLIFSAGPTFGYSRAIHEGINTKVSVAVSIEATVELTNEMNISSGFKLAGSGVTFELKSGGGGAINQSTEYGAEWESGKRAFNGEKFCCYWGIYIPAKERPGEYGRERV